jgi:transitional endoplasmic reticulum ATPase
METWSHPARRAGQRQNNFHQGLHQYPVVAPRPDSVALCQVFRWCQGAKYAIRAIFSHARIMAPCLLIFEDLDSLVTDKTRSYFLNEVDGLESNDGILMIGSTNHLDALDPAISKRPSRFDRKYHFQLPGEQERIAYCQFWRRKLADNDMVDFQDELCPIIAKMTEGFSFAYLKELFVWALLAIAWGGSVEEEEAGSDKDTPPADANASDNTSNNGLVVVEIDDVPPQPTDEVQETGLVKLAGTEAALEKKKFVVPEVEVPVRLRDNILLKVIQGQIRMLREEMDNTKDSAGQKKEGLPGADVAVLGGRNRAVRRMAMRAGPSMTAVPFL